MAEVSLNGSALGNGLQTLLMAADIVPGDAPSYQLCKDIYTFHVFGQKMAEAPIRLAQSQKREITVAKSPGEHVVKRFEEQWKKDHCDKVIFNLFRQSRIYGIASVAMIVEGLGTDVPVDFWKLPDLSVSFNVLDPMNTAGSLVLSQDPNSPEFQKHRGIRVMGKAYHRSREVTVLNEEPIYISFTSSAFGFVGRSVYQRALFPLKTFVQTMVTDDLVTLKVGVIITKIKQAGAVINERMRSMVGLKRNVVKEAVTGNVISVGNEDSVESLNMQNLDGPYGMARTNCIKNVATAADMPAKLLENETMVSGFGEGTEDAKNIAKYVDRTREEMEPAYAWFDEITMYRAWTPEFFATLQAQFPEQYGEPVDLGALEGAEKEAAVEANRAAYVKAFYAWKNSFETKWPSLLTEPDSEKAKTADVKLKAIIAALEVLMPNLDPDNKARLVQWAQDNINAIELLFDSRMELDIEALRTYVPPLPTMQAEEQEAEEPAAKPKPFSAAA